MKVLTIKELPEVEIWADQMKEGKCTMHSLIQPSFCQTIDVAELIFTPGARTKLFNFDIDWVVHVTEGKGTLATDKEEMEISAGTIAHIPAGEPRWIGAADDSTLVFMSTHRPKPTTTMLE
jgi:quercetin dioxygenase-like cupin family protein